MKLALSSVAWLALALGACATTKPATSPPPTAGATAPAADGTYEFPLQAPQVGDAVTETNERTMVATVELSPTQQVHVLSSEQRIEQKEIVALDGETVTKLKVRYQSMTNQETLNGKPQTKPTPTVGKTYLVWRDGGELKVSYADGTAPPAAEIKEVRKGNRSVGRPDPLGRIIAEHGWRMGERFEFTAAHLAAMNQDASQEEEPSLTAMALTLQGVDDAVATMAMTMALAMKGPDGDMTFELAGTVKLDRKTGRPLEVGGTGPFSGVASLKMVGTMTMKTRYAY